MNGEFIVQLGSIFAAIASIGGVLLWIYSKLIVEPKRREVAKLRAEQTKQLEDALIPLTHALERLNELLDQSESDRAALHEMNRCQNKQLGNLEVRVSKLEKFEEVHESRIYSKQGGK